MITYSEVRRLNARGNVIPVFARIPADLVTPVAAYRKLALGKRESFLLESVEGGEKVARYSFLGFDPFLVIEGDDGRVRLIRGRRRHTVEAGPLKFVRELFRFYRPVPVAGLPRFTGGAVGYFAYDTARWIEKIPDANSDPIGLPVMHLGLYRHLVVFDHLKQEILLIANILHDQGKRGLRAKYDEAAATVRSMEQRLSAPARSRPGRPAGRARVTPLCTEAEYRRMVARAKRYIKEGDIFQVVLSRRWRVETEVDPLTVYRRLRRINPSPYMFLLAFGDAAVVGASPEMLVRIEQGTIETRPIAGTRPRGSSEAEDARRIADLLADPKELAEHTMLVDLGRNDLGRVSVPGSVSVPQHMLIERYSHVIHIVSSVVGRLRRGVSPVDGLAACFPAGTVSGAPKVRAMEIIDELEKHRRGVYAGAV
ncbi:MAG TPA: chorismate-binding protein, partial [candidate division Zixibacteria bacterium]|nr:chorismate-binding protein [candidate division Zixibacteria bacterium]